MDISALKEWFRTKGRDFPWRKERTPYRVWIAEVMLQQTQASVVIPYYERWMQLFPTLEILALASTEEVMKAWEGLGYYSRVRNLHAAAQEIVSKYNGSFPRSKEQLKEIKGLGPYTIGAILSFAFQERAPAIDGNVVRVLSRYFLMEEEIGKFKAQKRLYELAETLLPFHEAWVVMEALIELGAEVCKKVPLCHICPVKHSCLGFQTGRASTLPRKKPPPSIDRVQRQVVIVFWQKELLVRQIELGKVMGGLWEFPYFETEDIQKALQELLGITPVHKGILEKITHQFTHFHVTLIPSLWQVEDQISVAGYQWKTYEELLQLPFSSGHRRLLHQIASLC